MVDVGVFELIFLVILFFWLGSQMHRAHGVAFIFLFQLDRPDIEPTSLAVSWPIHLSGSRLPVGAECGVGRVSHACLRIVLLVLLQGDKQAHTGSVRMVLQMSHNGAVLGP